MISHFQPCKASFQHWSLSLMIWGDSLFSFLSELKIEKLWLGNKLLTSTLGTVQCVVEIKYTKFQCHEARISNLLISFKFQVSFKLRISGDISNTVVPLLRDVIYLGQPFAERIPNCYSWSTTGIPSHFSVISTWNQQG